jgi:hypothetical protein
MLYAWYICLLSCKQLSRECHIILVHGNYVCMYLYMQLRHGADVLSLRRSTNPLLCPPFYMYILDEALRDFCENAEAFLPLDVYERVDAR